MELKGLAAEWKETANLTSPELKFTKMYERVRFGAFL